MKTWRERIAARQANPEDAAHPQTCAWGEMNERFGLGLAFDATRYLDDEIEMQGYEFYRAIYDQRWRDAENILDRIEDRALQLKREKA